MKLAFTNKRLMMCIGAVLTLAVASLHGTAQDKKNAKVDVSKIPPASTAQGVTYAKDVKPIFEKSCIKCHGAEKQKGKLRLDTVAAVLKGGEDGQVIQPG